MLATVVILAITAILKMVTALIVALMRVVTTNLQVSFIVKHLVIATMKLRFVVKVILLHLQTLFQIDNLLLTLHFCHMQSKPLQLCALEIQVILIY